MQRSITSFFGAPKDGPSESSGGPSSPAKKSLPSSTKPSKTKTKVAAASKKPSGASLKASDPRKEGTAKGDSPLPKEGEKASSNEATVETRKRKAEQDKGVAEDMHVLEGSEENEEEEEGKAESVKPKRLRRLSAKVIAEDGDSDEDMFSGGRGLGVKKPAARKKTVDDEDDGEVPVSPKGGGYKGEVKQTSSSAAASADDGEEEEDMDEDDKDDDEEEEENKKKTVSSALMAGAKKSKVSSSPTKTKGNDVRFQGDDIWCDAAMVLCYLVWREHRDGLGRCNLTATVANRKSRLEEVLSKVPWKNGQSVPYGAFCDMLHKVEQTSSRLEITRILCEFLCQVISTTPQDLATVVYLAANELAPAYEGVELGIGDAVLQKAIVGATGRSAKDVKAAAVEAGDLGKVAQHSTKAQGTLSFGQTIKTLSCPEVLERYRGIARVKGSMSQDDKIKRIKKMLVSCKGVQAKYIIRGLQGRMRVGLNVSTVMVALSHAAVLCPSDDAKTAEKEETAARNKKTENTGDNGVDAAEDGEVAGEDARTTRGDENDRDDVGLIPVARKLRDTNEKDVERRLELATQLVKQAYSECPNFDLIVKTILSAPLYRLQEKCHLIPGMPVSPMLAKPTKSIGEVLQRLSGQEFTCEFKYDGMRAQVHLLEDGSLRFFSRNSKDSSGELPDVIPVMKDCVNDGVKTYVIDTEVVAYDRESGNLLPFQMLSTRGRKDVDANEVKVKVIVEAFDILYLNGKSLLQKSLKERRTALRNTFKEVDGRFRFATYIDHKEDGDTGPIEEFLSEAVRGNCEGLMVKTLTENASYEPSRRSLNWLKLKKDYLQADDGGVGDSLDLVPIGAYYGTGKRTGRYGAYLIACYDPDREEYQSVSKIATGFTDELLLSLWEDLKEHTLDTRPRYYNAADSLGVDVWLAPRKVWEVKCADLSKSPVHRAAIGKLEGDRGISIRFPRLLRERDDKDPEQATTADEILDMYENQDVIKNNATTGAQTNVADDDWEL